jgi:hypothetical protein
MDDSRFLAVFQLVPLPRLDQQDPGQRVDLKQERKRDDPSRLIHRLRTCKLWDPSMANGDLRSGQTFDVTFTSVIEARRFCQMLDAQWGLSQLIAMTGQADAIELGSYQRTLAWVTEYAQKQEAVNEFDVHHFQSQEDDEYARSSRTLICHGLKTAPDQPRQVLECQRPHLG